MVNAELLKLAERFHGHICPFLVLGLRASEIAFEKLGLIKPGVYETISEDIVAIVEANNCFADGVQIATGCTLGNNSLVYIDLGKNAVTILKRYSGKGIRVYIDAERLDKYIPREARELFHKVVIERRGSREEAEKLNEIWREIGLKMATLPEEEFKTTEVEVTEEIERAPIFESIRCSRCGELAMSTRVVYIEGKPYCLTCAGMGTNAVIGRGIVTGVRTPYRISKVEK
ncbi:MAG: FmdE family protein [Desulfurococcaceae archaeon]